MFKVVLVFFFLSAFIDVIKDHDSSWHFNIQLMEKSFVFPQICPQP